MNTRRRTLAAAFAAAVLIPAIAAPAASAVTRYATPGGATTGTCQTEAAACDIQRAVGGFFDTTEVVVMPGTYDLANQGLNVPPGVDLHGQAGKPVPELTSASAVSPTVQVINANARVADLRLVKTAGIGGGISIGDATAVVERIVSISTLNQSVACGHIRGVLRDSVCMATGADSFAVGTNLSGPGTFTGKLRNVTAVAIGNGSDAVHYTAHTSGTSIDIDAKNVIAVGGSFDAAAYGTGAGTSASVSFASSNYSSIRTSGTVTGTITDPSTAGNQTDEPEFQDIAAGDLRQTPGSPTVDAGVADAVNGSADILRGARVRGPAIDIGAHEYAAPVPTPTAVTPASGTDDNNPRVKGSVSDVVHQIRVFTNAACSGAPAASGDWGQFVGEGIAVPVPDNSTTTFWVRGVDGFGHESDCSAASVSYTEVTPPSKGGNGPGEVGPGKPVGKPRCSKKKAKGKGRGKKRCSKKKKRR